MLKNKGFISLLLAAFVLGTFGVWIRQLDKVFTSEAQVVARSLAASLIILLIIFYKKIKIKVPKEYRLNLLGFSIVFPISILCFTYSAVNIKVSNALFMLYVGSLVASFLWGKFVFSETFNRKKLLSLILLLAGLIIFVYPFSATTLSTGVLVGICAGLLEGSAHAFRKKLKDLKREIIVLFQSISGLSVGLLIFSFSGDNFTKSSITPVSIMVAILFGFLLVAIGYLLAFGFSHFDVNVGSVVLATELFFALIINYIFLKESPTTNELIGGTIIFIASIATSIDLNKIKKLLIKT